ncbi:hypothetical protein [Streptosporangium subroseum]|uniref:hypothetical protein n=1 Tax=Streptosporangium subroseum TaxID=106412 RepID=UPI003084098E
MALWITVSSMRLLSYRRKICRTPLGVAIVNAGHRPLASAIPPGVAIVNARHRPLASTMPLGAAIVDAGPWLWPYRGCRAQPLRKPGVGPTRECPLGRESGPATGSGEVVSGDRAQEAAAAEPLLAFVFAGAESFDDDVEEDDDDDEELDESDELEEPEESEELDVEVDVEAAELTVLDEEARLSVR